MGATSSECTRHDVHPLCVKSTSATDAWLLFTCSMAAAPAFGPVDIELRSGQVSHCSFMFI